MNNQNIKLTDEQLSAVEMVKNNYVSILTGGPGTGKTTTIKEILTWAQSKKMSVIQCAPTGKAAKRMEEATNYPSSTIHKALGATMEKGKFVFFYGETCPLLTDLIIVDEVSMVTNNLMASLLRAIDKRTKILFVGDQGQLPSVGVGAVLRDFLDSGVVPHIQLTKIHRNSGDIVKVCHAIQKGEKPVASSELDIKSGKNFRHIEASTPEKIIDIICQVVMKMKDRGYDPVWDVQVISPTNVKTNLSCENLNSVLQGLLNPKGKAVDSGDDKNGNKNGSKNGNGKDYKNIFRIKDKVIQTKNEQMNEGYIVNGDLGFIKSFEKTNMKVNFLWPDREVAIPQKKNDLLLAYCITCHRMQGSEAPVVIIPVHKCFGNFVTRSWIYTAISRAKDICFTVGQFRAVEQAAKRIDMDLRLTMLREKLQERFFDGI